MSCVLESAMQRSRFKFFPMSHLVWALLPPLKSRQKLHFFWYKRILARAPRRINCKLLHYVIWLCYGTFTPSLSAVGLSPAGTRRCAICTTSCHIWPAIWLVASLTLILMYNTCDRRKLTFNGKFTVRGNKLLIKYCPMPILVTPKIFVVWNYLHSYE